MAENPTDELSALYKFDETNGTIDPADYDDVEAIVDTGIRSALGIENDVHTSTPLGRMMEWLTIHFTDVLGLNVQNANQLLISAAAGQQLDAMAQWFQLERRGASYTKVEAQVSGTANKTIPAGSRARSEEGYYFAADADITLDGSGNGTGTFSALQTGPIPCPAGSLIHIDSADTNWTSISNAHAGVMGRDIETDESLRRRIEKDRDSAPGFLGAIKNALEKVDGVLDSMVIENNTGAQLDVRGIPMAPHSIFACVNCGNEPGETVLQNAAKAIFENKPCGTGYTTILKVNTNGNAVETDENQKAVTVTDAYGNNHVVYMYMPETSEINVSVSVIRRKYAGANLQVDIQNAVNGWFSSSAPGIGETIYASDILKYIEEQVQGIIVADCKISDAGHNIGVAYIETAACQKAIAGTTQVVDETR